MRDSILILLAGAYDVGFGIFHLYFPKLFMWDRALPKMDLYNRGVLLALHWLMMLVFAMVGIALVAGFGGQATSHVLLIGGAIFWTVRAGLQPVLWPFQSRFAYVMFAVFLLGIALHAGPVLIDG